MTRHIHDRSNSGDIARHFLETQDGAPLTAHYIPAVDYVRQDWQNGTLARITRTPRRLWPFLAPLAALLSLALSVAIWGHIG